MKRNSIKVIIAIIIQLLVCVEMYIFLQFEEYSTLNSGLNHHVRKIPGQDEYNTIGSVNNDGFVSKS